MGLGYFILISKKVSQSPISQTQKADLVITGVQNVNGRDYSVTIQNKGNADASKFFYVCMWDDEYIAQGNSGCNGGIIANYDGDTQMPIPLKAGSSRIVTFSGIFGLPANENLYFVVDKSNDPKTNNSIDESDETNNNYIFQR